VTSVSRLPVAFRHPSCEAAAVRAPGPGPPRDHSGVVARFVDACSADDRVVAAFLAGSRARSEADEYSDLDLCVITTDDAAESFTDELTGFIRQLGEPIFVEDFGFDRIVFIILSDGTELELFVGHEGALEELHTGPSETLIDKRNILSDKRLPFPQPDPAEQQEQLRRVLTWFWHDLSHLTAALARSDLWWAQGQLEALRRYCVNLVRIDHGVEAQEEAYEKLQTAVPVSELAALQATFTPMQRDLMVRAAVDIVAFFRKHAPRVAAAYGSPYPAQLERVMSDRLDKLALGR
jgi:hypothetical protein